MSPIINKLLCLLAPRRREYLAVDKNFNILETSIGVHRFADCPHELVKGKDVRDCFPELIGLEDICTDIFEQRQLSFEVKGIGRTTEKGSPLYLDVYIINNPDKKTYGRSLTIFLEDVTDKMLLEQSLVQASNEKSLLLSALAASKDYVDTIITSIADALIVTKYSGTIKTINRAAQNLFGYSEVELIEKPISTIIADSDFLNQASQQHLLFNKSFKNVEVICKTKNGNKITVAFACSVIQTEAEGLQDLLYLGRDITEHQRTRQRQAVQHTTTRILSESVTIRQALEKLLQAICETLQWDLGEIWLPEEYERIWTEESSHVKPYGHVSKFGAQVAKPDALKIQKSKLELRCVETWVASVTWQTTLVASDGLPRHVWETRSPHWVTDIVNDANLVDCMGHLVSPFKATVNF